MQTVWSVILVCVLILFIAGVLYFVGSTVNPILYNVMSRRYRLAFLETICGSKTQHHYPNSPRFTNGHKSTVISLKEVCAIDRNACALNTSGNLTCNNCPANKNGHVTCTTLPKIHNNFHFDLMELLSTDNDHVYNNRAKEVSSTSSSEDSPILDNDKLPNGDSKCLEIPDSKSNHVHSSELCVSYSCDVIVSNDSKTTRISKNRRKHRLPWKKTQSTFI